MLNVLEEYGRKEEEVTGARNCVLADINRTSRSAELCYVYFRG